MLYQIPQPVRQVDQGATKQDTKPIPPVSQPEFAYALLGWEDSHRNRYIVDAPPQIHQGATKMATFPVPPVTTDPPKHYYVPSLNTAWIWEGPRQFFDGATQMRTDPIPPVTTRPEAHFVPFDENRFMDYLVKRFDGAPSMRTDPIPSVSEPEISYWILRESSRNQPGARPQLEQAVVVVQDTMIYLTKQPEGYYRADVANRVADANPKQFTGATVQQQYIFPPNQPDLPRFEVIRQALRFIVDATKQEDQGSTLQQTYIFPPNEPEMRYEVTRQMNRYIVDVIKMSDKTGATLQQTYIFPVTTKPDGYFGLFDENRFNDLPVKRFEGATTQQTNPVPPVSQPEMTAYERVRQMLRFIVDAVKQEDQGATKQAWFIYPPNQPMLAFWLADSNRPQIPAGPKPFLETLVPPNQPWFIYPVNQPEMIGFSKMQALRYIIPAVPQYNGPTTQQTYVFQPGQPEITRVEMLKQMFRYIVGVTPRYEGPTTQATFIFPPNQPEFTRTEAMKQMLRYVVDARARLDEAATSQQEYLFPPNQPELNAYERVKQVLRYIVGAKERTEGPTQQDWFIYPNGNPLFNYYWKDVNRIQKGLGPKEQFDGATVQQTFIFPSAQQSSQTPIYQQPSPASAGILAIVTGPITQIAARVLQNAYGVVNALKLLFRGAALQTRSTPNVTLELGFKSVILTDPESSSGTTLQL